MSKYWIYWDAGFGRSVDVIKAKSLEQAQNIAYDNWREEVDSYSEYGAHELTDDEIKEILGHGYQ